MQKSPQSEPSSAAVEIWQVTLPSELADEIRDYADAEKVTPEELVRRALDREFGIKAEFFDP